MQSFLSLLFKELEICQNVVYLNWIYTFILESINDSDVSHTQLKKSCCNNILHCKVL